MSIDLEIRHLRMVVAVADRGGFSAAAHELGLAQSSLSRSVLEVERRVGVRLFERSTRRVSTTADGVEFVALARRLVTDFDHTLAHFEGYLIGLRGTVTIGALPSLAATLLPAVLSDFRATRPDVQIEVRDGLLADVLDLVRSGMVDLALAAGIETQAASSDLVVADVAADRFACIFAPDHPFAALPRGGGIALSDLDAEPFVHFDQTSSIRRWVDEAMAASCLSHGQTTQARNIGAVAGLVGAGIGVSLVPGLVLPMTSFAGLEHRWLDQPPESPELFERRLQLVRDARRPISPAAAALVTLLAGEGDVVLPEGCRWLSAGLSRPGPG